MSRCLVVILVLFGFNNGIFSQFAFEFAEGARSVSIGRSSVALSGPNSIFGNQAAMVYTSDLDIAVNASKRYSISGLNTFSLGLIKKIGYSAVGINLSQFGFDAYREQKIGIAYARKLSNGLNVGVQLDYLNLIVPEFDNKSYFSGEIGIYTEVSPGIHIGCHIFSPFSFMIDEEYSIPTRLRIGPKVILSEEAIIFAEIEKVIDLPAVLKCGMSYTLENNFDVHVGVIPTLSEFTFGFSFKFDAVFNVDGGFNYNQRLGITPAFGLSYSKM